VISNLRLQNFRSYLDDSFEFDPGVNIIVGPNASGKTNLLEALLVLARGSSYRASDKDLILFGELWFRLVADVDGGERIVKLETDPITSKTFDINSKVYKRLRQEYTLPVVLFEPNHLTILSGSPEKRRLYLDDLLEQTRVGYGSTLRAYQRALAQRNALLKKPMVSDGEIFPWDVRLAELGAVISRARSELVAVIDQDIGKIYSRIARTKDKIAIVYQPEFKIESYESVMLKKLEEDISIDRQRGFTGHGPHREDFSTTFNSKAASEVASRGELRTTVLCLKILEVTILGHTRQQTPIMLLDDVFSELDGARRQTLTSYLRDCQSFITTTDADIVVSQFTGDCNTIALTKD